MTCRLLVFCLSLVCISGCVSKQPGADAQQELLQGQLDLGVGYLQNQDYPRAKDKLNRALEIDPASAPVHTTLGLLFQLEGENALAEQHFKTAIAHDDDLAQARNNYGAFLYSQQRYEEAVAQFSIAAKDKFYINRAAVFENLGVVYVTLNDQINAEDAFLTAIRLNPGQSRALLELAESRFNSGQYVESSELYNKHLRLAAHSARSLWLCIRLSDKRPISSEAETDCQLTLKNIYPRSKEYRFYLNSRHNKSGMNVQDE